MSKIKTKPRDVELPKSRLFGAITISYPETVDAARETIARLAEKLNEARERAEDEASRASRAEDEAAQLAEDADDAQAEADDSLVLYVNQFLDECERVGVRRYRAPDNDRVNSAIIALHDIAGRNS